MNFYQDKAYINGVNNLSTDIQNCYPKEISKLVLKALLMEVSIKDKPGLIGPDDTYNENGINYADYINSIITLHNGFRDIIDYAFYRTNILSKSDIIWLLQKQVEVQQASLKETYGELDNQGIVLTMGIAVYAASLTFRIKGFFDIKYFRKLVSKIYCESKSITKKTLITSFCDRYNVNYYDSDNNGLNKECNEGFPLIFDVAFPVFIRNLRVSNVFRSQSKVEKVLYDVLLLIISQFTDLNIVRKKGFELLQELKSLSKKSYDTVNQYKKQEKINKLKNFCDINSIVPKGAANILSVAIFIFYLTELNTSKGNF